MGHYFLFYGDLMLFEFAVLMAITKTNCHENPITCLIMAMKDVFMNFKLLKLGDQYFHGH